MSLPASYPITGSAQEAGRNTILLRATGLRKAFDGHVVLAGVEADLREGHLVLLRGAAGSGKTTMLNILSGVLAPDAGAILLRNADGTSEHFTFPQRWWREINPFDHFMPEQVARARLGRTWQDLRLFSNLDLVDNIAVASPNQPGENPLRVFAQPRMVARTESRILTDAIRAVQDLGLAGRERSRADRISLGQARRLSIARANQAGARIILLDEPLSGLDDQGIEKLLMYIKTLRCSGVTLVVVEHMFNISRLLPLATEVWTLSGGVLHVQSPEAVHREIALALEDDVAARLARFLAGGAQLAVEDLPGGAEFIVITPPELSDGRVVLEARDLLLRRGPRFVAGGSVRSGETQRVSFQLREGQLGIIRASNGWGKTTLLAALAGLIKPESGIILLNGRPIEGMPSWSRVHEGLGLLQASDFTFPTFTVRELFRFWGVRRAPAGLRKLLGRRASDLSGGEKRMVALACHRENRREAMLLDEPFAALDAEGLRWMWELLRTSPWRTCLVALPSTAGLRLGVTHEG